MSFTYETDVPEDDGTTKRVKFVLKPITQVPVGVLRRNRNNQEAQMWATFEWGVSESQLELFDRLPAGEIETILEAWQESGERDQDKPDPKKLKAIPADTEE